VPAPLTLQLEPSNPRARYYSGISMAQSGKPELAMKLWGGLLAEGSPDAPWKEPVRAQMRQLSSTTGLPLPQSMLSGEWSRLIGALSVLGDQDQARAIYREAQNTFAENEEALSMIKEAAANAGLE